MYIAFYNGKKPSNLKKSQITANATTTTASIVRRPDGQSKVNSFVCLIALELSGVFEEGLAVLLEAVGVNVGLLVDGADPLELVQPHGMPLQCGEAATDAVHLYT